MSKEFIGQGIAFPLRLDATGGLALADSDRVIEESIRLILATAPGDRPMRPDFGCGIHDYVFAPMDATTAGRIVYEVRAALARWEPRIEVLDVDVTMSDVEPATFYIDLTYQLAGANDPRNLVFPFYVIPSEE